MANDFAHTSPAPVLQQVQQHLDAIKAALTPYFSFLTPVERKTLPAWPTKRWSS